MAETQLLKQSAISTTTVVAIYSHSFVCENLTLIIAAVMYQAPSSAPTHVACHFFILKVRKTQWWFSVWEFH